MRPKPQESDPVEIEAYKTKLLTNASNSYVKMFLDMQGADKDGTYRIISHQTFSCCYPTYCPKQLSLHTVSVFLDHLLCLMKTFKKKLWISHTSIFAE